MFSDIFGFIRDVLFPSKDYLGEMSLKLERKRTSVDEYRALVRLYFDIHEVVFGNVRTVSQFTVPDHWLSLSYSGLLRNLMFRQENEEILKSLPPFIFDDYSNLEVNAEGMINNYPLKRQRTQEYMGIIEKLFYKVCKLEGHLSEIIEDDIKYDRGLIREHKAKRGGLINDKSTLSFTAHDSARKKVYKILENQANETVDKKHIIKTAKISYDSFRAIIAQLRIELKRQGIAQKIESDKKGRYKLTTLDSK
jgi:predicted transcriptional regulator